MVRRVGIGVAMAVATAGCTSAPPADRHSQGGERIISIDYCADQMLLGLVGRHRIAAVSVDADNDPLFAGPRAAGLPRVRAEIERIIALQPTMVVRSYGGGPRMTAMLERAGIPVFTLPYADSLASVRSSIAASGAALGAVDRAGQRIAALDTAIASAQKGGPMTRTALYMTPGDVTTGPGGLIADLFGHAGYRPYERRSGWHRLPVERLIGDAPDLVVRAFFESASHQQDRWSSAGHKVLARRLTIVPSVTVPGSHLACGNWLVGDALTAISGAGR
jgi:iron complex transport system substrate-binding protein